MATANHAARAHALLSASSSARWLACPPSAVAAEAYPRQDNAFTQEGTLAHEVAEWVADVTVNGLGYDVHAREDWAEGVTPEMIDCAVGYAEYIQEQIKEPGAVVLLERRVDYSDWVPGGFGTCDCIIIQGDTLIIIDYKYGVGVPVSATDNSQLRLYALGALNDYGIAYNIKRVEMHIYQPRINNIDDDSTTTEELLAWAEGTVKPTAAKAAKGQGEYKAGSHCKFCPHAGSCRELTQICTEYVETHNLRVAIPKLAPHEVAEVLAMEPLVALWLKRVKAQALETLLQGGSVPGYKAVEGKLGNRKWTDEIKVAEKLRAEGYQLSDITETKLLSPAAMDKAIGKKRAAELLEGLTDRAPGAPTIAPENDNRPAFTTADDFKNLEE